MPSTYTHYRFGLDVLTRMDFETADLVKKHIELFLIGLHGPDILFYYHPLKENDVNRIGYGLHSKKAVRFFDYGRMRLRKMPEKEAGLAYLLGFICHFALDSECHGYIEHVIQKGELTHTEIETELERALLLQDCKELTSYNTASHIVASEQNAYTISSFFESLTSYQVYKSLRSMKRYNALLVPSGQRKMWAIKELLMFTGNYKEMHGLIMDGSHKDDCAESNKELMKRYSGAMPVALYLISDFMYKWYTDDALSLRFHRTFGPDQVELNRYKQEVHYV